MNNKDYQEFKKRRDALANKIGDGIVSFLMLVKRLEIEIAITLIDLIVISIISQGLMSHNPR